MATGPLPSVSNRSDNFLRVVRLVMQGGKELLKEKFDSIHPPANLSNVLQTHKPLLTRKKVLLAAQISILYPSNGNCTSGDFDITLLLRLLKDICSLTPPNNGWYDEPLESDMSVEADLVRIRCYRNELCHTSSSEIDDKRFISLWNDISEVFFRIAASINTNSEAQWKKIIENFKTMPLSSSETVYFQELLTWYEYDLEVKKSLSSLHAIHSGNMKGLEEVKKNTQEILCELRNIKVKTEESKENLEKKCPETAETSTGPMKKNISTDDGDSELRDTVRETEKRATNKTTSSLSISVDVASADPVLTSSETLSATSELTSAAFQPSSRRHGNQVQPSNYQELMIKIGSKYIDHDDFSDNPHAFSSFMKEMGATITGKKFGSLVITVQCKTLQSLDKLWEEYTSGRLNEMAEKYLITPELLKELGFVEIKLKIHISEEEYQNYRRLLLDEEFEGTLSLPVELFSTDLEIPPSTAMQMGISKTDETKLEENIEDVWESRLSRDVKKWHFVAWEMGSKVLRFSNEDMVVRNISKDYPSLVGNCGFSEGCHCWKIEVKRGKLYAVGVTDSDKLSAKMPYQCYWSDGKAYRSGDSAMKSHTAQPSNISAFLSGDVCLVYLDLKKKLLIISHLQAGQTDIWENIEVQDSDLFPYLILAPLTKVSLIL